MNAPFSPKLPPTSNVAAIHAVLSGSDTCSALGLTVRSYAPVLKLCGVLLAAGFAPDTPLEVYRGGTLALRVRTIGQGAQLEVNGTGTGFARCASPVLPVGVYGVLVSCHSGRAS